MPSTSANTGTCYQFSIQHLRLLTPAATPSTANGPATREGYNRIFYDVFETAVDTPTNFSTVRRACADVLYVNGTMKIPLTGTVNFVDTDFVDITQFNATTDCKDLTKGLTPEGAGDGGAGDAGTGEAGAGDAGGPAKSGAE